MYFLGPGFGALIRATKPQVPSRHHCGARAHFRARMAQFATHYDPNSRRDRRPPKGRGTGALPARRQCKTGWFMSVRATFPAIAIVACSLLLPLAAPESAGAEACLMTPKGQAPAGSHWYYRLERPSMRKCWRLVAQQEESAAARTASRSAKHA